MVISLSLQKQGNILEDPEDNRLFVLLVKLLRRLQIAEAAVPLGSGEHFVVIPAEHVGAKRIVSKRTIKIRTTRPRIANRV